MNEVQAIKDRKHINRIRRVLHGRNLLLFTLGINVGLRISDLLELKVGQLRGKNHVVVFEGKTKKRRVFALNDAAREAIDALIPSEATGDDYAFPSRKGSKPIGRVQAYRILNNAIKDAGLSDHYHSAGTHTMRKTFGYFAYKSGTDISLLMRVFNHSSQKETLRYIGIEQEQLDDVYFAVNL